MTSDDIARVRSLSPLPPLSKKEKKEAEQELIDFDLIKSSSLFHTKPSKHNKELVKIAFRRIMFFPFCRQTCTSQDKQQFDFKFYFYCTSYILHCIAVLIYYLFPERTTHLNTIEAFLPIALLIVTAICYARASAMLLGPDSTSSVDSVSSRKRGDTVNDNQQNTHVRKGSDILVQSEESNSSEGSSCSASEADVDEGEESCSSCAPLSPRSSDTEPEKPQRRLSRENNQRRRSLQRRRIHARDSKTPSSSSRALQPHDLNVLPHKRINVRIWDDNDVPTKLTLSIDEVRSIIISKVKATPPRNTYRYISLAGAILISVIPFLFRVIVAISTETSVEEWYAYVNVLTLGRSWVSRFTSIECCIISVSSAIATFCITNSLASALADAELTYHHRFLYAKCFTALTSSRRARQVGLPHFRLKNVVNIKAWFSLRGGRSWLKRQGHQRAADEIVSSCFFIVLLLLLVMGIHVVDTGVVEMYSLFHVQVTMLFVVSSIFLLRFMMIGSNINKKYQNTSLLLTEQMNLYLRMVQAPHKKDRLLISNNVLKLATKLLKELRSPNKISGLTMNPLLYNISRVVVLSAISAAMTDVLGFKLKIWKI